MSECGLKDKLLSIRIPHSDIRNSLLSELNGEDFFVDDGGVAEDDEA